MAKFKSEESQAKHDLSLPSAFTLDIGWLTDAKKTIDCLLDLAPQVFWSTLIYNKSVMPWLDDVVDCLPRPYDVDARRAFSRDVVLLESLRALRASALVLFLRISLFNPSVDKGLCSRDWMKMTRDVRVMSLRRFSSWTLAFAPPNKVSSPNAKALAKALQLAWEMEGSHVSEDIITLVQEYVERLNQLDRDIVRIGPVWETTKGVKKAALADVAMSLLEGAVDLIYSMIAFYRIVKLSKLKTRPVKLILPVCSTIERFAAFLSTETTQDIAIHLDDYPLRKLHRLRTQLLQFTAEFVGELFDWMNVDDDKRTETLNDILVNERVMVVLKEQRPLSGLVSRKATKEQMKYIEEAVNRAEEKQREAIVNDIRRLGLLKNVGDMTRIPSFTCTIVDELLQIFPHLSTAYLHACLRHCAYSNADTVDMIVTDTVPRWMKRLEKSVEWAVPKGNAMTPLPPFVYVDEDCDMSEVVGTSSQVNEKTKQVPADDTRNFFKGVFSLAPVEKKEIAVEEKAVDVSASSSKAMESIRSALERLKLRAMGEDKAFGMENEKIVEMKTSKVYARIDKFKTTQADKVALRPFYEKFKYESKEMAIGDEYEDEYDDGYEDKAFATDPITNDEEDKNTKNNEDKDQTNTQGRYTNNRGRGSNNDRRGGKSEGRGGYGGRGGSSYTGGRDRQVHERNKNKFRQRGADKKNRGAM